MSVPFMLTAERIYCLLKREKKVTKLIISVSLYFDSLILYFKDPQKFGRKKNYKHYYLTQQDHLVSSSEIKKLLTTNNILLHLHYKIC